MSRFTSLIALILAWTALAAHPSCAGSKDPNESCRGLDNKIVVLIDEYKELRERRRHLADGVYDKDLRDHGGKLHSVLQSLGTELGHPPFTRKIIVGCLGEPDATWDNAQIAPYLGIYERKRRKSGRGPGTKREREYLVYQWRGGHDFMFFITETGLVVDHGWWFAYE